MKKRLIIKCGISITICLLIGFLTTAATETPGNEWYANLEKPFFHPPTSLIAPIWIILYVMIGIAAGIVWNRGFYHKWVKIALYHFAFQLILNGFWPILFFGLHQQLLALFEIILLLIVVLYTIKYFKVVSNTAAYLLYPYAIWILYAAVLNFEIWRLNLAN